MAIDSHITVNLVRYNYQVVFNGNIGQTCERITAPRNTYGVMGIGKDKNLALIVDNLLQLLEIHLVGIPHLSQRIHHNLATIMLGYKAEGVIDGRLDDNLISRLRKHIDNHTDTLHNSRNVSHPLALHLPAVMATNPLHDTLPIAIVLHGVTQHSVLKALLERINNKVGRSKIHIGNPQRDKVLASVHILERIELHAVRTSAVEGLVEVVNLHII